MGLEAATITYCEKMVGMVRGWVGAVVGLKYTIVISIENLQKIKFMMRQEVEKTCFATQFENVDYAIYS